MSDYFVSLLSSDSMIWFVVAAVLAARILKGRGQWKP